jgi:hypothetical protein
MQSVNQALFFETISTEGANDHLDIVDGVVTHVVTGVNGNAILIPILYDEIPGQSVAIYLEQLGMLDLLAFLVPDHPAAEFARRLTRNR